MNDDVIERLDQLEEAVRRAADALGRLRDENERLRRELARLGAEPMDYDPGRFNAYLREEIAANAALVKAAGIKTE